MNDVFEADVFGGGSVDMNWGATTPAADTGVYGIGDDKDFSKVLQDRLAVIGYISNSGNSLSKAIDKEKATEIYQTEYARREKAKESMTIPKIVFNRKTKEYEESGTIELKSSYNEVRFRSACKADFEALKSQEVYSVRFAEKRALYLIVKILDKADMADVQETANLDKEYIVSEIASSKFVSAFDKETGVGIFRKARFAKFLATNATVMVRVLAKKNGKFVKTADCAIAQKSKDKQVNAGKEPSLTLSYYKADENKVTTMEFDLGIPHGVYNDLADHEANIKPDKITNAEEAEKLFGVKAESYTVNKPRQKDVDYTVPYEKYAHVYKELGVTEEMYKALKDGKKVSSGPSKREWMQSAQKAMKKFQEFTA